MGKICLDCDAVIVGRSDKKFCSDECRNNYNNRLKAEVNNYMKNVNHILKKNRRILIELNPNGKSKAHKDKLMKKGFNFNYYTNTYKTKKGAIYYFCYEHGYLLIDHDFYALVKREEYVD